MEISEELLDIERIFQNPPPVLSREQLQRMGFRYGEIIDREAGYRKGFFSFEAVGKLIIYKEDDGVYKFHHRYTEDIGEKSGAENI